MKRILLLSSFAVLILSACQKDVAEETTPPPGTGTVSAADKVKDTSLMIAREAYLWYKQIPTSFNPRTYADPNKIMQAIRQYSNEPGFSEPVDRWSFAMLQKDWDNASSGISGDLGIGIFFRSATDLRVTNVEPESVAGKAGVQRTWRITKINGSTDINTSDASINFIVDAIYGGNTATITFLKPDGTSVELTLAPGSYQEHPLVLDTVYKSGGKSIGYLVLNSFLGDQDQIKAGFGNAFNHFTTEGVTEMIVDLRYNGGGYVSLQQELANYLAPNSVSAGTVMYKQTFNDILAQYNSTVNFAKKGTLSPTKIVFIISQNTASASEALINIMKPHLEVKTVGPSASNGKPVGYFDIPVGEWYVFPVSLRLVNSLGQGSYFAGFIPDKQVIDGLDKPWGDLTEDCLASAMKYLTTGAFRFDSRDVERSSPEALNSYNKMQSHKLKVMVEDRVRIPGLN